MTDAQTQTSETRGFQAEVAKLLHLMVHSVYSDKEIFLRELVSNASDACDRLRYLAIENADLLGDDAAFRVDVAIDGKARELVISDNGVGMSREELIDNLGTIARSGTQAFLAQMAKDKAGDVALIGQFGVGFYSAFMVAREVEVTSRRAGTSEAWHWTSDGQGEYTVAPADKAGRGTAIRLKLRDGEDEFLGAERLGGIIRRYSDHIAVPIFVKDGEGEAKQANSASALWARAKSEIKDDQVKEFFHHVGGVGDPWLSVHAKAEGLMEYALLLCVPSLKPFDLFEPSRKHHVKLYVRRVFIAEDAEGLIPRYLRFLKGVIDSQDLPLNLSREMLQNNPVIGKIAQAATRRVLAELEKKAADAPAEYETFWENFGAVLKEGLYEDRERREELFKLLRVRTTQSGGKLASLEDYVGRMKEGQDAVYFITGDDAETVARSPQIEGFKARGLEVLLLADPVDDFWINVVGPYKGKAFKSATRGGHDLAKFKPAEDAAAPEAKGEIDEAAIGTLVAVLKQSLDKRVKDVRASDRLTESAVCLVAGDNDLDMHLARMLKAHKQIGDIAPRVLEINPRHALIRALAARAKGEGASAGLAEAAELLLDLARVVEGESVPDPAAFARRLADAMARAYGG
ncbi:MAG: molecular chaperone HtpG [Alphaproteobacteria bacterium]|nr:molecular chaperone HtpG [Alphaproteobacteria bacterium]